MPTNRTADLFKDEDDVALDAIAGALRSECDDLLALLPDAMLRQWTRAPIPRPREEADVRRSSGEHGDPTGETVIDVRRMRLRAAVLESERELHRATLAVRAAHARLARSLTAWYGGTDAGEEV